MPCTLLSISATIMAGIDHIFNVLDEHNHPFILVGVLASRWMGCEAYPDEGIDVLFRTTELHSIVANLTSTGLWEVFNPTEALAPIPELVLFGSATETTIEMYSLAEFLKYLCDADVVLKKTGLWVCGFEYLRIWSEETYHIDIGQCPLVEVPNFCAKNAILVEEIHHPALGRAGGWWYGPRTFNKPEWFSSPYMKWEPEAGKESSGRVFIPGIPAYFDALVRQCSRYECSKPKLCLFPSWQIRNLTRYLYLELPHSQTAMLFQVEGETENFLERYFERYARKPRYTVSQGKVIRVKEWDPQSYPDHVTG